MAKIPYADPKPDDGLGNNRKFAAQFDPSNPALALQPQGFQDAKKRPKNLSEDEEEEEARWTRKWQRERMQRTLRRLIAAGVLPNHPVRNCRVRAIPEWRKTKNGEIIFTGHSGFIELHHFSVEPGRHFYSSRERCRNLLIDPCCAAEYGYVLRLMIMDATRRLLEAGYYCFMITQTARHTREMQLETISKGFQEARRWLSAHKTWKSLKTELGILGDFTALEITDDAPEAALAAMTGWHWHTHKLVFYKPQNDYRGWFSEKYARSIERRLRKLWQKALRAQGLDCDLEHGLQVSLPRRKGIEMAQRAGLGDEARRSSVVINFAEAQEEYKTVGDNDDIWDYDEPPVYDDPFDMSVPPAPSREEIMVDPAVKKFLAEMKEKVEEKKVDKQSAMLAANYLAKAVTWEISGSLSATKKGRKAARISTWEMLSRITDGDSSLIPRYAEFMKAVKGRAFMTWSHGLKAFVGLPEDLDAFMKKVDESRDKGDKLDFLWNDKDYLYVGKYGLSTSILRVADDAGEAGEDVTEAVSSAMGFVDIGMDPYTHQFVDDEALSKMIKEFHENELEERKRTAALAREASKAEAQPYLLMRNAPFRKAPRCISYLDTRLGGEMWRRGVDVGRERPGFEVKWLLHIPVDVHSAVPWAVPRVGRLEWGHEQCAELIKNMVEFVVASAEDPYPPIFADLPNKDGEIVRVIVSDHVIKADDYEIMEVEDDGLDF